MSTTPDWTDQEISDARFVKGATFTLERIDAGSILLAEDGTFTPGMQLLLRDEDGEHATITVALGRMWADVVTALLVSQGGAEFHDEIRALVESWREAS